MKKPKIKNLNEKTIKIQLLEYIIKEQQNNLSNWKITIDFNILWEEYHEKVSKILFEFKINKYLDENNNITKEWYDYLSKCKY